MFLKRNTYRPGDYLVSCDICGVVYYRSQCKKTWDNLISCPTCFDGPRNPQDYLVVARADKITVSDPRGEPEAVYVGILDAILYEDGAFLYTEDLENVIQD